MNDDELILYYYGDGLGDAERQRIAGRLAADAGYRERYERLCADLDRLAAAPPVRVPPQALARWHASIAEAAAPPKRVRTPRWTPFAWGALLAAALVAGIGIGVRLGGNGTVGDGLPAVADAVPVPDAAAPSVAYARGLQLHLRESRQALADLPAEAGAERAALIMALARQNRLYERAAERAGADDVARLLRAFEPVLVEMAAAETAPDDAARLQSRLAFELNVMLTKLARRESEVTGPI